jgi:hypothetical protein
MSLLTRRDATRRAGPTAHTEAGGSPEALYAAVAAQIEAALQALHAQLRVPAGVAAAPQPPTPAAHSRLYEWATTSPASRELGRHVLPAGFAASGALQPA